LEGVVGSGPGGRILVEDVEGQLKTIQEAQKTTNEAAVVQKANEIAISPMRATIAERLSASCFTAPHIFLRTAVGMDTLLDIRRKLERETGRKISLNAYIMKLASESLKRHPRINASWQESSIHVFPTIDIALAVALSDGLITPVVRDCGNKGIQEIDQELVVLIEKAKSGKLTPSEYANSTFTISNLGGFGIEEFTAIINPPGSAILALGSSMKEAVVLEDDTIGVRTRMRMTLSCDHRSIDGAVGAAFLQDLQMSIQEPLRALL
jgi:pyruvate dehydrogenase E2 component (dihydrolipoamide acetyltransferase)